MHALPFSSLGEEHLTSAEYGLVQNLRSGHSDNSSPLPLWEGIKGREKQESHPHPCPPPSRGREILGCRTGSHPPFGEEGKGGLVRQTHVQVISLRLRNYCPRIGETQGCVKKIQSPLFWHPKSLQKSMRQNDLLLFREARALAPCRWAPRTGTGCENGIPEAG